MKFFHFFIQDGLEFIDIFAFGGGDEECFVVDFRHPSLFEFLQRDVFLGFRGQVIGFFFHPSVVVDFVKNGNYVKLINYFTVKIDLYHKNKNELLKECCLKSLEIIIIIFEACLGIKKPDNLNADGNIYYFD